MNHENNLKYALKTISNSFVGEDRFDCIKYMNKWLSQKFIDTNDLIDIDKKWTPAIRGVKLDVIVTYRYQYDAND